MASSPFLWIAELLCRTFGIDAAEIKPDTLPPTVSVGRLEEILLAELSAAETAPVERLIVLHFGAILAHCPDRRQRLMTVVESNANSAIANLSEAQVTWVHEALIMRFSDLDPAVDAVFGIARRLFGADFDPSELPARILVRDTNGLALADLWPQPAVQQRLANRLSEAGVGGGDGVDFEYRPFWDVANQSLTSLMCIPRLGGVDLTFEKLPLGVEEAAGIDAMTISHVAALLPAAAAAGRVIGFPVHQTTLTADSFRDGPLAPFIALSQDVRSQAAMEVVAIGADCSRTKLRSVLRPFKANQQAVDGRFHISQDNFSDLFAAGFRAVGTDVSMSQRAEAELLEMLSTFAANANDAALSTYIQGLGSVSLKTAAQSAGFATIGGEPVCDPLAGDIGDFPLSLDQLYGNAAVA